MVAESSLLTWLIFTPLIGVMLLLFIKGDKPEVLRWVTLLVTLFLFLLSLPLYFRFTSGTHLMQFTQKVPWIPRYGIHYSVGIDGISLFLVLLTTFLMPICILSSWRYITRKVKQYMIAMLMLETGMLGVFVSLDLFLFYIFWEAMLIPMYLLIGVWGGPRRIYAAVKFFLYTMAGSLLMLVAILFLYSKSGMNTFDILKLYEAGFPMGAQIWMFLAFAVAFAIKVPMFPFHTWLPDAHVEAPTAGSVILAAVLLKMGTYGFLRLAIPLFPQASQYFSPLIISLSLIAIIYGALVAMVQPDVKKLVAYSSVSHLGFVMLGIYALNVKAMEGGIYQMLNHGLSTGALFLLVGIIYERRHTRLISDFGGLQKQMPLFGAIFLIVVMSSVERFRGGVSHTSRRLPVKQGLRGGGRRGRHPQRLLHALDVSADDVRQAK
jgi:NADH-quinone oxidoreductase subunit M